MTKRKKQHHHHDALLAKRAKSPGKQGLDVQPAWSRGRHAGGLKYVLSLEKNHVMAYQRPGKERIVVVFPTLCKEWDINGEDDFDKVVKLIDYYFLLERVCWEIDGSKKWPTAYCRRFRNSRCRCEYVVKRINCKLKGF